MTLRQFLDAVDDPERSLVVANRSKPEQVRDMLEAAFDGQSVRVDERDVPEVDDDTVLLIDDGDVVATSPLEALEETILLVNSDLYRSGAQGIETLTLPDVIGELDDVRFSLRGYPKSNTEKLLLILVSRYIERVAWLRGRGRLRSSFQRLSRITDENGTRGVYETLAGTGVDVHVYGVPDWIPPAELGVTVHGGYSTAFRDAWFVVFAPEAGRERSGSTETGPSHDPPADDVGPVALLAVEVEPRVWEGFWTFDPSLVGDLNEYVARGL